MFDHMVHRDYVVGARREMRFFELRNGHRNACCASDLRRNWIGFESVDFPAGARHTKEELSVATTGIEDCFSLREVSQPPISVLAPAREQREQHPARGRRWGERVAIARVEVAVADHSSHPADR